MISAVRKSSRAGVISGGAVVVPATSVLSPMKLSPRTKTTVNPAKPLHNSKSKKSLLRCFKKVRQAVIITNRLVESRKSLFKEWTSFNRVVVGFYQRQVLSRCQMHAVNNACGKNHLTVEFIEAIRVKSIAASNLHRRLQSF